MDEKTRGHQRGRTKRLELPPGFAGSFQIWKVKGNANNLSSEKCSVCVLSDRTTIASILVLSVSFEKKTKSSKNDTTAELFLLYLLGIEASCAALVVLYIKDIFYPS